MTHGRRLFKLVFSVVLAVAAAVGAAAPALARVEITLDAATITEFLSSVTPPKVILDLPSGGELALELRDVKVLGFDPSAGKKGQILASLRLGVPALGLDLPVEPRLSLDVEEVNGEKLCVLRFDKVTIPLPMTGSVDLSSLLPVYRLPAESTFLLNLKSGDVNVKSRLIETKMGAEAIRLGFNLEITPVGGTSGKEK